MRAGRILRPAGVALAAGLLAGCLGSPSPAPERAGLPGSIWDVQRGAEISREDLAAQLAQADFAILGEIHDNPAHHERQAWLVAEIAPGGLAFEMVPEGSEDGIQAFLAQGGSRGEIGPAIGWDRLGWPDWALYAPIFTASESAYIAGGGVPRKTLRAAMQAGAALAFGPGASAYGLDRPLPQLQAAAAKQQMIDSHCGKLPESAAGAMVEAQRLRDGSFAHALRRAAAAGGGKAVLITGNGHAQKDRGVPRYLAAADPERAVGVLGQVEVHDAGKTWDDYATSVAELYDYVWFSEPAERGDPCAAFK